MVKITIRDVAREAEVGIGTVSRVLNNSAQVSDDTRQRVMKAIDRLGYKPSAIARQLARKVRPKNIGVVTRPFLKNYYSFAERLRGVQTALQAHREQYELMLFSMQTLRDYDQRLTYIIQTGKIDGMIFIDILLSENQRMALETSGIPFILISHINDPAFPCVTTDNRHGGYLAGLHLVHRGHQRIAYVGDQLIDAEGYSTSRERYQGFAGALAENRIGLPNDYVKLGEHGWDPARELMQEMLALSIPPTAVFAMSDTQALGCMAAIRQAGLRVPDDISVIGYDDLELSQQTGLTTVRQHLQMSGEVAMHYLLQLIQSDAPPPIPQLPPLTIVERETTGPPGLSSGAV